MEKYVHKPYLKKFARFFERKKERLQKSFKENLDIEHVGSTAVPGLGGKGIIDIVIGAEKEKFELVSTELQKLGYEFRSTASTDNRLFYRADLPDPVEGIRRYHVHLVIKNGQDWHEIINFRNHLIDNPDAASEYNEIKKLAVEGLSGDGERYKKIKEPFIKEILRKYKEK